MRNSNAEILGKADTLYSRKQWLFALFFLTLSSIAVAWMFFDAPYFGARKLPGLHGKTETQILEKLGSPDRVYEYTMDEAIGEFRVELFNTYRPNSAELSTIKIRECTWEFARNNLTVWFHQPNGQWVALNTLRYDRSVQF